MRFLRLILPIKRNVIHSFVVHIAYALMYRVSILDFTTSPTQRSMRRVVRRLVVSVREAGSPVAEIGGDNEEGAGVG